MRDEFLRFGAVEADAPSNMQRQPALDPATSLAEYAARTTETAETVGRSLRVAAERAFTGELLLSLGTGVRVFLDDGRPYFAERVGDAPLGQRLVSLGVLTDEQRLRGRVLVGDVEHLGRLFERDTSIDRDPVLAAVEVMTDELLTDIALSSAALEITPFRHHASGVHRWFVGPIGASTRRPIDAVAQLDRSVFEQLPDAAAAVSSPSSLPAPTPEPMMQIRWDLSGDDPAGPNDGGPAVVSDLGGGVDDALLDDPHYDLDAEWERFDAARHDAIHEPVADAALPSPATSVTVDDAAPNDLLPPPGSEPERGDAIERRTSEERAHDDASAAPTSSIDDPFTIVWPDGTVEAPAVAHDPSPMVESPATNAGPAAAPPASSTSPVSPAADQASLDEADPPGPPAPAPREPVAPDITSMSAPRPLAPPPIEPRPPTITTASFAPPSPASAPTTPPPTTPPPPTFSVPPLEFERLPEPDAAVPDDVADAVRRALAAIERAASEPEPPSRLHAGTAELPDFSVPSLLDSSVPSLLEPPSGATVGPEPASETASAIFAAPSSPAPAAPLEPIATASLPTPTEVSTPAVASAPIAMSFAAPTVAPSNAFAPPAVDRSAEVVEVEAATPHADDEATSDRPEPGKASVVFVDDDDQGHDRSGALRRLIGSLRRSK